MKQLEKMKKNLTTVRSQEEAKRAEEAAEHTRHIGTFTEV
jgi:hypothetical protein